MSTITSNASFKSDNYITFIVKEPFIKTLLDYALIMIFVIIAIKGLTNQNQFHSHLYFSAGKLKIVFTAANL